MELQKKAEILADFIKFCKEALEIETLPKIKFISDNSWVKNKRTFGEYTNETKSLVVYVKNRNLADICRTLAHEMTHHKQNEMGTLGPKSGETGSPIENDAHDVAGICLREYGKIQPLIYESINKDLKIQAKSFIKDWTYDPDHQIDNYGEYKKEFNVAYQLYPYKQSEDLYRGLNFNNIEDFNNFKLNTKNFTVLKTKSYSSWSPDINQAIEYSLGDNNSIEIVIKIKPLENTNIKLLATYKCKDADPEYEVIADRGNFKISLERSKVTKHGKGIKPKKRVL